MYANRGSESIHVQCIEGLQVLTGEGPINTLHVVEEKDGVQSY